MIVRLFTYLLFLNSQLLSFIVILLSFIVSRQLNDNIMPFGRLRELLIMTIGKFADIHLFYCPMIYFLAKPSRIFTSKGFNVNSNSWFSDTFLSFVDLFLTS